MSTDSAERPAAFELTSDDTLLLLNRATVVMHTVRSAAHELNNVLQMISGSAELLELNPDFPASMRPRLQAITNNTSRGCDLVGAVADLARAQQQSRGQVVDVRRALERVAQLRKFEQSRSRVDFTVQAPVTEPLMVRVDASDLHVMLLNLVINGEQAVAETAAKVVTATATGDGTTCQIVVADSGQGSVREAECFSPFFTTRSPLVAPGLGLAATRLLAARHGGQVALRQAAAGVEAVLTLPMAART